MSLPPTPRPARAASRPAATLLPGAGAPDPLWYKDAVVYEVHVRAFSDSDGDGNGDVGGLVQRLDYLQDLGVTAIWLLPFYPSPLRDDGYDISSYKTINPVYGKLADFRTLLREAHRRDLRVITELVVNHTSDQHPWFQRARRSRPGSSSRNFYVWSDSPERYAEARVIFKDFETSNWTWDPVAGAYYWHRFYSHQPDLNYDNPEVRKAISGVMDFWLDMGVDGLRLDAVPYLFEREGTNCENLPETLDLLKELRRHVDERYGDRMLLAEANQWPEDAAAYFGQGRGDGCHMAFHFPLMPRMFMAIRQEDRFPIIDILTGTPEIPETAQWALFLRNHDELTLEMVTDEERDYMYRAYAQDPQARINLGIRRRLAPLLSNDRRVIEMMNGLLFSLPGTPVVYYGDEIGMGDNIYLGDRNGVRTPMQWSADRNAGFSRANPQRLFLPVIIDPEYHYEAINVEAQQNNPQSLLWWNKRMIALRKRYRAFGHGTLEFLYPENRKVLAYLRRLEDEQILVVANLSRHAQYVELDLSAWRDLVPLELFGQTQFPPIGELPYLLTLGPHAFYWFSLHPQPAAEAAAPAGDSVPSLEVAATWDQVFAQHQRRIERRLPAYLRARRWFGGKTRTIRSAEIRDLVPVRDPQPSEPEGNGREGSRHGRLVGCLAFVHLEYAEGDAELYLAPFVAVPVDANELPDDLRRAALVRVRTQDGDRVLVDGLRDPRFSRALLQSIARGRRIRTRSGTVVATPSRALAGIRSAGDDGLEPSVVSSEQSNTSIVYGDRFILKLVRRLELGVSPELEVGRFLTYRTSFDQIPMVVGALEYRQTGAPPTTLAVIQGFVPNEGDAWTYTLDTLSDYLEEALARGSPDQLPFPPRGVGGLSTLQPPAAVTEAIGGYLDSARLLGQRTAELHMALASGDGPAFAPERFSSLYQRSQYQSMRGLTRRVLGAVRRRRDVPAAARFVELEPKILGRFESILRLKADGMRIRCHGDYHLGQVLFTGRDFVIIDFEGEPARPLGERRIKRSPLVDVAGMIRSFDYARHAALAGAVAVVRAEDREALEPWAGLWFRWVAAVFLGSYLKQMAGTSLLPATNEDLQVLLDALLLEKAVYEVGYEVDHRPDWLEVPVRGIEELLEERS